jgi:LysR family transcriptional regulator, glycine cleavage system transcriptional activator
LWSNGNPPTTDRVQGIDVLVRLVPGLSRPASWRFVLRRGPSRRHRMLGALIDFLRAEARPQPAQPDADAAKGTGSRI